MIMPNYFDNCPIFICKTWSRNSHNLHILATVNYRWGYFGMICGFSIGIEEKSSTVFMVLMFSLLKIPSNQCPLYSKKTVIFRHFLKKTKFQLFLCIKKYFKSGFLCTLMRIFDTKSFELLIRVFRNNIIFFRFCPQTFVISDTC